MPTSLSALDKMLSGMEQRFNAIVGDETEITYLNDPEEGLEHLRLEPGAENETIEIGDGKPQPVVSAETLPGLAILAKVSSDVSDAARVLTAKPSSTRVWYSPWNSSHSFRAVDR